LSLREDFLHPALSLSADSTVELSPVGYQFFAELFAKFDKDKDGALSWDELEELFATAPENPWLKYGFPETTLTNEAGFVTLQGFLAQWSMATLLDYMITLEYLAHLGFSGDTRTALRVMRGKRFDRPKDRTKRDVFLCLVVGAVGSGKVCGFLGNAHLDLDLSTSFLNRSPLFNWLCSNIAVQLCRQ
jgi:Ras family protein T1